MSWSSHELTVVLLIAVVLLFAADRMVIMFKRSRKGRDGKGQEK